MAGPALDVIAPLEPARRPRLWEWSVPLLAAASLLAACAVASPKRPYWLDELLTHRLVTDPSLAHMVRAVGDQIETVPPLYHVLLRGWARLAGTSEIALRLFTAIATGAAFAVVWAVLRRHLGFWAASLGAGGAFLLHDMLLLHSIEARFYGLLVLWVALALLLYDRARRTPRPGAPVLACTALVHGALVLTHPYGPLYSLAALLALVARDRRDGALRPRVYLSLCAGWLAFAPWLGAFLHQAAQGEPRSWLPPPGPLALLAPLYFSRWIGLWLLGVALLALPWRPGSAPADAGARRARGDLLAFAAALLAVAPVAWILSHAVRPIFHTRYLQPQAVAWAILLSWAAARLLGPVWARARWRTPVAAAALGLLLLHPLQRALALPARAPGGAADAELPLPDAPLVLESHGAYLVRHHYRAPRRDRYVFVLDWEAATAPGAERLAPAAHKLMAALERNYPDHYQIVDAADFLRATPRFLFLDERRRTWGDLWLAAQRGLRVAPIGRVEGRRLLLVERAPPSGVPQ